MCLIFISKVHLTIAIAMADPRGRKGQEILTGKERRLAPPPTRNSGSATELFRTRQGIFNNRD